jgi:hypothetical protein
MSFQAMSWAIGLKLPAREKFVLLMLANYASNDKGDCYPSLARLAEDTGMVNNTVIAAIQRLEEMGALAVQRRKVDGVNLPNVYRLNLAWGGSASDAPPVQPVGGGSASDAHEPVIEPITKKKKESVRVSWDAGLESLEVPDEIAALLAQTYGTRVDVPQEVAKASAWLRLNPARRPKSDYGRFLNGWISRAADRRQQERRTVTKSDRREAFMEGLFGPAGGSRVIDVDATVVG